MTVWKSNPDAETRPFFMRFAMHNRLLTAALLTLPLLGAPAWAKLPPPTPAAKAAADETAAKGAWNDKVTAYQTCKAGDRVAESYRAGAKAAGKDAPAATPTPACTDPGPYVAPVTAQADRPIEAAGAHSPPATAVAPPSGKVPQSELKPTK